METTTSNLGRRERTIIDILVRQGKTSEEIDKYLEIDRKRLNRRLYGPTKRELELEAEAILEGLEEEDREEEKLNQKPKGKESYAEIALNLIFEKGIELWQSEGKAFMTVEADGHFENHAIRSTKGRLYPGRIFYDHMGKSLNKNALDLVLSDLEAVALFDGKEYPTFIRVGKDQDGYIYHDLCNKNWEVVKISPGCIGLDQNPPIKFIRTDNMKPLPYPDGIDSDNEEEIKEFVFELLDDLWELCNLRDSELDERSRIFVFSYLLACLNPDGPFPVPFITGEKGSAKSNLSRLIGRTIDPKKAQLVKLPTNDQDLFVLALNNWILGFDNNSGISGDISDAMCSISTGGGYGSRGLYTNNEENCYEVCKPQLINGIGSLTHRPDLLDRVLPIHLRNIPKSERMRESEINKKFEDVHPYLLSLLYTYVSNGLSNVNEINLKEHPRMADFAHWICACIKDHPYNFFDEKTFIEMINSSATERWNDIIESDPFTKDLIAYLKAKPDLEEVYPGTLWTDLLEFAGIKESDIPDGYPKAPRMMSSFVERAAPVIRDGADIDLQIIAKDSRTFIKIKRPDAEPWVIG